MAELPNVVFIITDNQSPWTLGCYGNDEIRTPNVDRLAREGVKFARAYCVNPVCSPNRATCLTGLTPSQHGVHNWLGTEKPSAQMGPHAYCTIEEFTTLPEILASEGYQCGMTGKWHLGDSLHPQLGFSYWFTIPYGHTKSFYNAEAIWQEKVYKEPRYMLDVIAERAVGFLHQVEREPFFLYVGFNGPYGLDQDLRSVHRNRHTDYYADKELRCFPREEPHPWLVNNRDVINNVNAMRNYAAAVSGVDDGVGTILQALAELGLEENTLVIYTADHGLCGGHHGMWGMGDHSRPLHMFDPNLHVPLIFRHPARIKAGQEPDFMVCNYDFLPSVLDYLGLNEKLPSEPRLAGRSYAPALIGKELSWDEEVVFHEYENTRTVRTRDWKLTRRHPDGPDELYDLRNDPGERVNLIEDGSVTDIREELDRRLADFFREYSDPAFDLWCGGRNKAGSILDVKA